MSSLIPLVDGLNLVDVLVDGGALVVLLVDVLVEGRHLGVLVGDPVAALAGALVDASVDVRVDVLADGHRDP